MTDPREQARQEYEEFLRADARRLAEEARGLRSALDDLTVGASRRRRRGFFLMSVWVLGGLMLLDQHTEECVVDGPRSELAEFVCDAMAPMHDHSQSRHYLAGDDNGVDRPESSYPVDGRLIGTLMWATAIGLGARWAYRSHARET